MNSMKTVEINEKSRKITGGFLTQLLLSHFLFALTIHKINAISLVFYSMVRYADYLIYLFLIYMETLEIKKITEQIKGLIMLISPHYYFNCGYPT